MLTGRWPSPSGPDKYALLCDRGRERRLLVVNALFDEGNKLRHFAVDVMRRLDEAGIDSSLPDLPGTNESLQPLEEQTIESWRNAMRAAASDFAATHVLAIRGAALVSPDDLPNIHYAPASGATLLRSMLRAQVMTSRETGHPQGRDDLLEQGRSRGLRLAGYHLGPAMIADLESAVAPQDDTVEIAQGDIGGSALWLRAEPDHDPAQAEGLAALVARCLA